ncbi:HD family phosphohydrolase [Mucisphaera sp.]|uniref:HD family phosphohydrolase n=1 Tax=Mucisphaera sp. TaxID=2913024 RepID=UPI003D11B0C9
MAKQTSPRRREVRKSVARERHPPVQAFQNTEIVTTVFFAIALGFISGLIALSAQQQIGLYPGARTTEPVIARVEFQVLNQQGTERRRQNAAAAAPNVYQPDLDWLEQLREELAGFPSIVDPEQTDTPRPYEITDEGLERLAEYASRPNGQQQWEDRIDAFLSRIYNRPIVSAERYELEQENQGRLTLIHPNPSNGTPDEIRGYYYDLLSVEQTEQIQAAILSAARDLDPALRRPVTALVLQRLRPNYLYDEPATAEGRQTARLAASPQIDAYAAQQVLVPSGSILSTQDVTLLREERRQYHAMLPTWATWLQPAGVIGIAGFIAICLWFYVYTFKPQIRRNPTRGLGLVSLMLFCQAIPALSVQLNAGSNTILIATTFGTVLCAIILSLVYGQRFALAATIVQTALIGLSLKLSLAEAAALLAAAGTAIALLREVRQRSTILRAGIYGGLAMAAMTTLVGLAQNDLALPNALNRIGLAALWGGLAVTAAGMVVQSLLPQVEHLFRVTTAMTLKELNDASHPLLQRLAHEAPGTFQHSLRIADMAEAAADAIGADGLLCRVGAMYHDIGKVHKPQYFIENQGDGPNRHDKLSPAMSLLIIVGHVKDGIEMAREYRLPTQIRQFIESHHGTTLVEYFFHAAKKKSEASGNTTSEFEFRYPGPKPQTKEAAIMLICDGIEGAARALPDPTPIRLEQIVHTMASKRLNDGQFDECSLTLQDLSAIEKSITKTLQAMYHGRIKYPEKQGQQPASPKLTTGKVARA